MNYSAKFQIDSRAKINIDYFVMTNFDPWLWYVNIKYIVLQICYCHYICTPKKTPLYVSKMYLWPVLQKEFILFICFIDVMRLHHPQNSIVIVPHIIEDEKQMSQCSLKLSQTPPHQQKSSRFNSVVLNNTINTIKTSTSCSC